MKTGKSTNGENAAGLSSMNVSPQEMELLLKELVDKQVTHIKFGQGKITSLHDRTVKVAFDGESGEKAFVFPGAFGRFLKISDPKLQQRMNELFFNY